MGTHIIRSVAAPAVAPTSEQLGVHWLKTSDPVGHWLAVDTSVDGWLDLVNLPSGGGSGEANTTSNVGTGSGQLAKAKDGVNLPIKTIKQGANVTVTNGTDEVEIAVAAPGETNTLTAQGTGVSLVGDKTGSALGVKTLVAGTNVTITEGEDELTINASGGSASTSVMVPIAMATTYLQLSSSIGHSGDDSTWVSYDRINMSAVGPASYDPDDIVDNVNQVFIVPAGATHFSVDYMINVSFESDAVDLLVEFGMQHKPMPWVSGPGGLVVDHVDIMTSSNNSFAYKTMTGSSAKIPCTPGNGISFNLYWEGVATAATNGVNGLSDSAVTITFYTAP